MQMHQYAQLTELLLQILTKITLAIRYQLKSDVMAVVLMRGHTALDRSELPCFPM